MKGVVAAGNRLTAEAGAEVLREGGNAFDAAICAVLASLAVESPLTGLGGGGFLLAHTASGEDVLLDFFVEAGGRGLDPSERGELVEIEILFDEAPQLFNIGPASCGVPGVPAGLWEAVAAVRLDAVLASRQARRAACARRRHRSRRCMPTCSTCSSRS